MAGKVYFPFVVFSCPTSLRLDRPDLSAKLTEAFHEPQQGTIQIHPCLFLHVPGFLRDITFDSSKNAKKSGSAQVVGASGSDSAVWDGIAGGVWRDEWPAFRCYISNHCAADRNYQSRTDPAIPGDGYRVAGGVQRSDLVGIGRHYLEYGVVYSPRQRAQSEHCDRDRNIGR